MRWYYSTSKWSESWDYGGESEEAAREEALGMYGDDAPYALAHEMPTTEEEFWDALANQVEGCLDLEEIDVRMGEDGWIDFEDGWFDFLKKQQLGAAIVVALKSLGLERPKWRTITDATDYNLVQKPKRDVGWN